MIEMKNVCLAQVVPTIKIATKITHQSAIPNGIEISFVHKTTTYKLAHTKSSHKQAELT